MADTPYPYPKETRETDILVGTGVAEYGPFGFKIFDTDDVVVLTKPAGQTLFSRVAATVSKVSGDPFDDFTVDFGETIPPETQFIVRAERVHDRQVAVTRGGAISTDQLEKELSKQGTVIEELRRDVNQGVRGDYGSDGYRLAALPAGHFWKSDGQGGMVDGGDADDISEAQGHAADATAAAAAAKDWAIRPVANPVPESSGGDGATTFSALHWAKIAEGYANEALNNWTVERFPGNGVKTDFELSLSPGTGLNCFITIDGVLQQKDTYSVTGTTLSFTEAPPGDGLVDNIEVAYGSAIEVEVGTPTDGSVTEQKLATGAVTTTKIANGAATNAKIADNAINAAKINGADAAAILSKLGVVQTVKKISVSHDLANYSTTTQTQHGGALGNGQLLIATPSSPTTRMIVICMVTIEATTGASVDDAGGEVAIKRFDGSAYVSTDAATSFATTNFASAAIRTLRQSLVLLEDLGPDERRSDGGQGWSTRLYGNALYASNTIQVLDQHWLCVEYEPN
ncbi:hypothetical protein [Nitratireductor rhodophyticola]|uniref:hypothetical protein n=1 Tax=Nitratireductor rhodophyticola TaxID=2854036 RepID=UPI00300A0A5E